MRLVREALGAPPPALAEVEGDGEAGCAGGDVHGGAAGEVEPAHDGGPAVGVPGPAGDCVVDDGGPDEDEDHEGAEAGAFGDGADGEDGAGSGVVCE